MTAATQAKRAPAKKATPAKPAAKKPATKAKTPAKAPAKKAAASKAPASTPAATKPEWPFGKGKAKPETASKGKTTRKASAKPATPAKTQKKATEAVAAVAFIARKAEPGQVVTVLQEKNGRPTMGTRLFAHTHAALTILGMMDAACPETRLSSALSVMGHTAVSYHLKEQNFERRPNDMVRLTSRGYAKFKDRSVDTSLANAYVSLFLDGKIGPELKDVREGQTYKIGL